MPPIEYGCLLRLS